MNAFSTRESRNAGLALIALLITLSFQAPAGGQTSRSTFQEALEAKARAESLEAPVYSPAHFSTALRSLNQAEEDFQKRHIESAETRLRVATDYFIKAAETANLFHSRLGDAVKARNDARSAEAPEFRQRQWQEAESILDQAARALEEGDLKKARSRAERAVRLYRIVELESIKAHYLDETRALLAEAEKENAEKRAPATLSRAKILFEKAEKLLVENRYDTDEPRQLAREARVEAGHALHLSRAIEKLSRNDTIESLFLRAEAPLRQVGDELDLNPTFEAGLEPAADLIIQEIRRLKKQITGLKQDLADSREQIAALENQSRSLQAELASARSQMGDLKSREAELYDLVESQRAARETFRKVEETFSPEEALVVRQGGDVIIRLYGLTFPVGKAVIETEYFGLLAKVIQAIGLYPDCGITVEGHTDSRGSDELNQKLSTQRAEAVMKYLIASAHIEPSRISAVGHGENRPVATNETEEGRRKNRRIDVILQPARQ